MLTNIEINRLSPHPDNPRKDLGDLTELTESIKAASVLQNLTVVPWFTKITGVITYNDNQKTDPLYTVVIGHRRLAAAKLAGLTELPCIISNMSYSDQIATMLLENIQRSDLTYYEQAQGIQMMLDLGESVNDISEKTGLSESTVRRRVKMLELDQDKFRESVDRGVTLQDYIELEKIKDIDRRNEVLDAAGSNSFKWKLDSALAGEKWAEQKATLIEKLDKFATKVEAKPADSRYASSFNRHCRDKEIEEFTTPDDISNAEYFYELTSYDGIQIYRRGDPNEEENSSYSPPVPDPKQLRERALRDELTEADERAYALRSSFIREYSGVKKHERDIKEFAVRILMDHDEFSSDLFLDLLGIDQEEQKIETNSYGALPFDVVSEHFDKSPSRVLLFAAYCIADDNDRLSYHDWQRNYEECEPLDALYDAFEKIGYEVSDDERALRDGSHRLYADNENDDDDMDDPCQACKLAHPGCDNCCNECDDRCNLHQRCRNQGDAG